MEKNKVPFCVCTVSTKQNKSGVCVQFRHCWGQKEKVLEQWCCWGQVLGLNISAPKQGNCHYFRHPWKESLHQCWCSKMEIPSEGMGTIVQISGNQFLIPSCFTHRVACSACPTTQRLPWDALVTRGMHRIKPPRCQRTGAVAWGTGAGVMGAFHEMAALTGEKYWQHLCLKGVKEKTKPAGSGVLAFCE